MRVGLFEDHRDVGVCVVESWGGDYTRITDNLVERRVLDWYSVVRGTSLKTTRRRDDQISYRFRSSNSFRLLDSLGRGAHKLHSIRGVVMRRFIEEDSVHGEVFRDGAPCSVLIDI